jgi:SAM-dependent methyltransferase
MSAPIRLATLSPVCEEEARILSGVERQQLLPWLSLQPGKRLLEPGCGPGRWIVEAARAGAEVVGVDRVEAFLQKARTSLEQEQLTQQATLIAHDFSLGTLPETLQGNFDTIFFGVLLAYLDDEAAGHIIEQLIPRLRPGGKFVVKESVRTKRSEEEYVIEGVPYAALYRSCEEMSKLFTSRGLRLIHQSEVRGFPTIDLMERAARGFGFGSRENVDRMLSPSWSWWGSFVDTVNPVMVKLWPLLDRGSRYAHRLFDRDYLATQQLFIFEASDPNPHD